MNKKLLSLAVAGAMAVPMAAPVMISSAQAQEGGDGPTVYGRVRLGLQRNEIDSDGNNWGLERDSSRFGIRGTEDLGNGLSAFYRYEFEVITAENSDAGDPLAQRHAYVGLKNNYGALSFGRQTNTYYALTGSNYALGNSYTGNYLFYFGAFEDSQWADKQSDSIRYEHSIGNLTFGGDMVLDQDDDAEDINAIAAAAAYDFGFATLFGGYFKSQRDGSFDAPVNEEIVDPSGAVVGFTESTVTTGTEFETDVWTVGAHFNVTDSILIYGIYEDGEIENKATNDEQEGHAAHGGISFDLTDNMDGFFAYDYVDFGPGDTNIFTLGGQYHLSDRTRFYAEFEWADADDSSEEDKQIVGIRHDF